MSDIIKYGVVFSTSVTVPAYFFNEEFTSGVLFNTVLWILVVCVRRYVCQKQKLQNQN
jgi:hypothetical protein